MPEIVLKVFLIVSLVLSVGFFEAIKTYYKSGELRSEQIFKDSKKEGPYKIYSKSGVIGRG